jgi:hypothetical protein
MRKQNFIRLVRSWRPERSTEGKQLLEQIVNKKGFYANQAADELTKIKP